MAQEERHSWWKFMRWPVALGVLAWLIGSNISGVRELVAAGVAWHWVAAAAALRLVSVLLGSQRWNLLLHGQGIRRPYSRVFRLFATGYVCNFLLPGTVGGDVARAGMIAADNPERRMRGAATVPLDRLLGLLAFVCVGAVAGLYQWSTIPDGILRTSVGLLVTLAAVGLSGLTVLLIVRFPEGRKAHGVTETGVSGNDVPESFDNGSERRRKLGRELLYGLARLRESRGAVLAAFVLGMIGHSCLSVMMYCCLQAFPAADLPVNLISHLWIVPSAEVPAAMLPLPGGVGAREGTLSLLYGAFGTDPLSVDRYRDIGVVVAATFSTVSVGIALLIAGWLTVTGGWQKGGTTSGHPPA